MGFSSLVSLNCLYLFYFILYYLQAFDWICSVFGFDYGEFVASASGSGSPRLFCQVC